MKKLFTIFCLLLFLQVKSQNVSEIRMQQADSEGWVLLKDTSNIKFSVKEVNCNGNSIFLAKIENTNTVEVSVTWSFWTLQENEPQRNLFRSSTVSPQNKVEGECPDPLTMTIIRPLVHYLYNDSSINNLSFKLIFN